MPTACPRPDHRQRVEVLEAIEQLGAVRLLKTSFFAYPIVNALHIMAIGVLFTSVALLDLRVMGALRSLPEAAFERLFRRLATGAFLVATLTGATLFSVKAADYAAMPVFLLKLGLIATALVNFLVFLAIDRSRSSGKDSAQRMLACLSLILWTGVLLCGRFIGFL